VSLLNNVGYQVFADFEHENSVVSFSSKSVLSDGKLISKLVLSEVTFSITSFSIDRGSSLKIPNIKSLINAEKTLEIVLVPFLALINLFAHVMEKSK
jgi:hypothetical protein